MRHVFVQVRIARIPWAWLSHIAIFYGFIVLFIGTVIVAPEHYGIFGLFGIHWTGRFYTSTSFVLDLFGLAFVVVLGIAIARCFGLTVRASFVDPDRRGDFVALAVDRSHGLSGRRFADCLQLSPLRATCVIRRLDSGPRHGRAGARRRGGSPRHLGLWWVHMVAVFGFLAIIPYTKLLHVAVAPLNIVLTPEPRRGACSR